LCTLAIAEDPASEILFTDTGHPGNVGDGAVAVELIADFIADTARKRKSSVTPPMAL
jgi:hypothetical protein